EMLSAENKDSFLPARQKGSYLTCLDVSRKHGSRTSFSISAAILFTHPLESLLPYHLRANKWYQSQVSSKGDLIVLNPREKWTDNERKLLSQNSKAKNLICCALTRSEFNRISTCKSAKEMCDKLNLTYEGIDKVKETKIDILVTQYEKFQMITSEIITQMYSKFTDITNGVAGLGKMYNTGDMEDLVVSRVVFFPSGVKEDLVVPGCCVPFRGEGRPAELGGCCLSIRGLFLSARIILKTHSPPLWVSQPGNSTAAAQVAAQPARIGLVLTVVPELVLQVLVLEILGLEQVLLAADGKQALMTEKCLAGTLTEAANLSFA
ncbi:hypothetical protein Taro_043799, partial [Colocasia esculenta]|nr:hypothetical protein [Colocasia esculenta]